jgi:hypothetical protein
MPCSKKVDIDLYRYPFLPKFTAVEIVTSSNSTLSPFQSPIGASARSRTVVSSDSEPARLRSDDRVLVRTGNDGLMSVGLPQAPAVKIDVSTAIKISLGHELRLILPCS